ncbi:MAG: urea ABC transporter ATP-binding subunit UrtE [Thalassovita sp.]
MLNVESLRASYGESEVLHGLDLKVEPGEIVAIMGRNGMGKTTLMKTLMGIVPEKGGDIAVANTSVTGLKSHQRVANGIAYVPQGRMIFSSMTVQENVETGLTVTGQKQVPDDIYELFPVLLEMKDRRGGNLSGGQQQQLAIARALASNPKVLLLDEPTEGIQPSIIREMARTLRKIRDQKGLTIIVSEQVLSFALDVADRVMVIENGTFVHDSPRAGVDEAKVSKFLSV